MTTSPPFSALLASGQPTPSPSPLGTDAILQLIMKEHPELRQTPPLFDVIEKAGRALTQLESSPQACRRWKCSRLIIPENKTQGDIRFESPPTPTTTHDLAPLHLVHVFSFSKNHCRLAEQNARVRDWFMQTQRIVTHSSLPIEPIPSEEIEVPSSLFSN